MGEKGSNNSEEKINKHYIIDMKGVNTQDCQLHKVFILNQNTKCQTPTSL